jgi:hypothetical protein
VLDNSRCITKLSCIEIAFEFHAYQKFKSKEVKLIYTKQTKLVVLMTNWEDIPMIVMAHSKTFESSTSPAENPSTGFRINSAKKQRQSVAFIIHFLDNAGKSKIYRGNKDPTNQVQGPPAFRYSKTTCKLHVEENLLA